MALEVIGAGFGRTGTLSLKAALEQLGFVDCYHMLVMREHPEHPAIWQAAARGEEVDWDALFEGYRAAVDWPSCNFWQRQLAHWPDAKVLLSRRDPQQWYDSVMNTIYKFSAQARENPETAERAQFAFDVIWDPLFGDRMDDRQHVIDVYNAHNAEVQALVPAQQLLTFDPADGWEPLCAFLGVAVPDGPYPRTNTTQEFVERISDGAGDAERS
jgi:hypothetical protein